MLGDILRSRLEELKSSKDKKFGPDAFCVRLKNIAKDEIIELGEPVDSDLIIEVYYEILKDNESFIPNEFQRVLNNGQKRYRVVNRNLFSSNAFHTGGLATMDEIKIKRVLNDDKKGYRIVYQKR